MLPTEFYDEDGNKVFERMGVPIVSDVFGGEHNHECKAPDCDGEVGPFRQYCSSVCMNVGVKAAAMALDSAAEHGQITRIEDIPDREIAEIRRRSEQVQEEMNELIEAAE